MKRSMGSKYVGVDEVIVEVIGEIKKVKITKEEM